MNEEINADITVQIKEVKELTIMNKSRGYQLGVIGVLVGMVYGARESNLNTGHEEKSQVYWELLAESLALRLERFLGLIKGFKFKENLIRKSK